MGSNRAKNTAHNTITAIISAALFVFVTRHELYKNQNVYDTKLR